MKKLFLSIFVMGSFGLYVLWQGQNTASLAVLPATDQKSIVAVNTQTPVDTPIVTPPPVQKKTGLYNDGSYIGSVADAYYGNVQVKAIITDGKIADVQFLDYPNDRGTSIRINSRAMPYLTQEAIVAQSANVDGVSGASDTSAAFKESLASALSQARA